MGSRGPQPIPQEELVRTTREFYSLFVELTTGREWFDRRRYDDLKKRALDSRPSLTPNEQAELERRVTEIQSAGLSQAETDRRRRRQVDRAQAKANFRELDQALKLSMQQSRRDKRDVLEALLRAPTPNRVREICNEAFPSTMVPIFDPKQEFKLVRQVEYRSRLAKILVKYAEEFIAAKHERRYPHSIRKSSRLKQIWFLSCALAGAVHGIKTRTTIDRVGSTATRNTLGGRSLTKRAT
jgi:hypothetical protein